MGSPHGAKPRTVTVSPSVRPHFQQPHRHGIVTRNAHPTWPVAPFANVDSVAVCRGNSACGQAATRRPLTGGHWRPGRVKRIFWRLPQESTEHKPSPFPHVANQSGRLRSSRLKVVSIWSHLPGTHPSASCLKADSLRLPTAPISPPANFSAYQPHRLITSPHTHIAGGSRFLSWPSESLAGPFPGNCGRVAA